MEGRPIKLAAVKLILLLDGSRFYTNGISSAYLTYSAACSDLPVGKLGVTNSVFPCLEM